MNFIKRNKPKRVFSLSKSEESEFEQDVLSTNLLRLNYVFIFLLIIHLLLFISDYFNYVNGLMNVNRGYFYLFLSHIGINVIAASFLLFYYYSDARHENVTRFRFKALFYVFAFLLLFWAAIVSVIDQKLNGQLTVFIMVALPLSVFFFFPLKNALILFLAPSLFLFSGISIVLNNQDLIISHHINLTGLAVFTIVLSQLAYRQKKKNFEEVAKYQRLVEGAFEMISDAVFITDINGTILKYNAAAHAMNAANNETILLGKNAFNFIDNSSSKLDEGLKKLMQNGKLTNFEISGYRSTGEPIEMQISASITPNLLTGKDNIISVIRDVTDQKDYERKLIESHQIQKETSDNLKQIISFVRHEIKNPLGAIIGFAEVLMTRCKTEEEKDLLSNIFISASGINDVLSDLTFYRDSDDHVRQIKVISHEFALKKLVNELVITFKPVANQKNLEFFFEADAECESLMIRSDRMKIKKIAENLIQNAIKYTNDGHVKVVLRYRKKGNDKDFLELSVEDTGIGIPEDIGQELFDAYFRASNVGKADAHGTGLGLNLVKTFTNLLGGQVGFFRNKSVGTTMNVSLPIEVVKISTTPDFAETIGEEGLLFDKVVNILIVEDNLMNAKFLELILKREEFSTSIVENGDLAWRKVQSGGIDFVLMDIQMPVMNGHESTRVIRTFNPRIPIIGISANGAEKDREEAFASGMNDFMMKPVDKQNLIRSIHYYYYQGK